MPIFFILKITLLQIIVDRYSKEKSLNPLDKTKFLVPQEITMSQFVTIIRWAGSDVIYITE
jgi:hypothetical protein